MPPVPPFASDFLAHEWPLLVESCASLPRTKELVEKAQAIREPEALVRLAQQHGVMAQLAQAIARPGPPHFDRTLLAAVRSSRKDQLIGAMSLTGELFRVREALSQASVDFLATKGPTLACRAYGDVAARRYVDLDFLIRHADVSRAGRLLAASGYVSEVSLAAIESERVPGEYIFHRPGTHAILELHTERSFRYFPRPLPIEDFFRRRTTVTVDGRAIPALSAEDEFVLISVHGAKHFWERLMWVSDVAAMVRNHPELDWSRVRRSATAVGAGRMVRVALLLAERLLRVPIPGEMKREVDTDYACLRIVKKVETWLPHAGNEPRPLMQRALFRFHMRGQLLAGAGYLTRLSLSTTEEDWSDDPNSAKARLREALRRPFRLARKYRRDPGDSRGS